MALIDWIERIVGRIRDMTHRRARERRHRRHEERGPRTWPLVYPPPEEVSKTVPNEPSTPRETPPQH